MNIRISAVIVIATVVRVLYWLHANDEAWFIAPGMDPAFYSDWADAILSGHAADYIPFPRAPLYAYILAGIRWVFDDGWLWVRLFNLSADIVTIILIYRLARRVAGNTPALIASGLYALAGSPIYYSGELLMTSLSTLLATGFIYSLVCGWSRPTPMKSAISGMLLALAALCRPNMLVLLPFSGILMGWKTIRTNPKYSLKINAIHWMTAIIIIAPVTIANYRASGHFTAISTQGGVNFYIGNAHGATGWASSLPGVGSAWTDDDARRIAEDDAGRTLNPSEQSSRFWRMGWREITADPVGWMRLCLKKTVLLVNIREIGNNRPLSLASEAFPPLRWLFLLSFGAMLPLMIIGSVRYFHRPEVKVLLMFLVLFGGSLLLFFVNSRYRMPMMPVVAMLAGVGAVHLFTIVMHNSKEIGGNLLILVVGVAISIPAWVQPDWIRPAQAHFVAGNASMRLDRHDQALIHYRKAEAVEPTYLDLHLNIGVAYLNQGDTVRAVQAFRTELDHHPSNAKAHNNLGIIAQREERIDDASEHYRKALELLPNFDNARSNIVQLYLNQGDQAFQVNDLHQAEEHYRQAEQLSFNDPRPWHRLALLMATLGRIDEAKSCLYKALKLDPNYRPARQLMTVSPFKE